MRDPATYEHISSGIMKKDHSQNFDSNFHSSIFFKCTNPVSDSVNIFYLRPRIFKNKVRTFESHVGTTFLPKKSHLSALSLSEMTLLSTSVKKGLVFFAIVRLPETQQISNIFFFFIKLKLPFQTMKTSSKISLFLWADR